jgi:hypothetical protein
VSALPPGRGFAWIIDGFGTALRAGPAYAMACVWVGLCQAMPLVNLFTGLAMPIFYAGLVRALATADAGGRVHPVQAFAGFLEPGAFARLLPILLVHLTFVAGVLALLVGAGGEELRALALAAEGGAPPDPAKVQAVAARLAPVAVALFPVALAVHWLKMLAIPRAMLDGVGGGQALREAAVGVFRHLLALVVSAIGLVPVGVVIVLVFLLPIGVVGVLQASAPALAMLLKIPVLAALVAVGVGVFAPVMYRAKREVFDAGDAPAAPPSLPPDQIEA